MQNDPIVRKISSGYQITIPNEFRKDNNLNIGSMVSIYMQRDKLIIEPFRYKSEALKKLKELFKETPENFKNLPEQEVSKIVNKEIKLYRNE